MDDLDGGFQQKDYIDSYQIWSNWTDSNINIWPKCLQHFLVENP